MSSSCAGLGAKEGEEARKLTGLNAYLVDQDGDEYEPKEQPNESEKKANFQPHRFTDVPCLAIFLVACAGLAYVTHYAYQNGDTRRLYHGIDFLGNLCGGEQEPLKPFLYYCRVPNTLDLDLAHPVCVATCPAGASTHTRCFQSASAGEVQPTDQANHYEQIFHYEYAQSQDYETYPVGGYCIPTSQVLLDEMAAGGVETLSQKVLLFSTQVSEGWLAVFISAVIAVVCAWSYLLILRTMARPIVILCLVLATVVPAVSGCYLIAASQGAIDLDNIPTEFSGDAGLDFGLGIGLLAFGVLVGVIACCAKDSIDRAVDSIRVATECMFGCPSVLLAPILTMAWQALLFCVMMGGFGMLVATGDLRQVELSSYAMVQSSSTIGGIGRTFSYSTEEWCFLFFYAYMILWFVEIANALLQFTLAYVVQIWYFSTSAVGGSKSAPYGVLCKGVRVGVQYHLGSLAFGASLVSALRLVRVVLSFVAAKKEEGGQNDVVRACAGCCACLVKCFEDFVRYLNKNAYMDIAMSSNNFCTAASKAFGVIAANLTGAAVLNGACWIAQLGGIAAITAGGAGLSYVMCHNVSYFTAPTSDHYVAEPLYIAIVAGVIAAIVAWTFMTVFDTVADTLFYCFCVETDAAGSAEAAAASGSPPDEGYSRSCGWTYEPLCARRAWHAPDALQAAVEKQKGRRGH